MGNTGSSKDTPRRPKHINDASPTNSVSSSSTSTTESSSLGRLENGWWSPTIDNRLAGIDGTLLVNELQSLASLTAIPVPLFSIIAAYALRPYLLLLGGGPRTARADFLCIDPVATGSFQYTPGGHEIRTADGTAVSVHSLRLQSPLSSTNYYLYNNTTSSANHNGPMTTTQGGHLRMTLSSGQEVTTPSSAWLRLNWLPQPRRAAMAARLADSLYIAGGMDVNGRILSTVARLHMTTGVWTTDTPALPTARYGATSNVLRGGGPWIVCGGFNAIGEPVATVESFDAATATWETLPPMQEPRAHAASAVFGGRLYVFGGTNSAGRPLSSVESYVPTSQRWVTCMPMSTPRQGASACVLNHEGIVITGGMSSYSATSSLDTAYCYDPKSDIWTYEFPLPSAMHHHTCHYIEDHMIVVGGFRNEHVITEMHALPITSITPSPSRPLASSSSAEPATSAAAATPSGTATLTKEGRLDITRAQWLKCVDLPQCNAHMATVLI